jgi:hypothetical protein
MKLHVVGFNVFSMTMLLLKQEYNLVIKIIHV